MSKKSHSFNEDIWRSLLELQVYLEKRGESATVKMVAERFNLSLRYANSYMFALNNRDKIIPEVVQSLKIQKLEDEVKKLKSDNSNLLDEIKLVTAKSSFIKAISTIDESFDLIKVESNSSLKEEVTAITALSDAHVEEVVESRTVNGFNEYNPTIAEMRVRKYFTRLLYMIRSFRKSGMVIDNLVLNVLGDLISGYIHEELLESNALSPTLAARLAKQLLIEGIKYLAKDGDFKKITILMLPGNHGRTSRKKKYSTGYANSYEWIMYHDVKDFFEETPGYDNVNITIPYSQFGYVKVYDKVIGGSHGDHFRYMGGVGGVLIPMTRWKLRENEIIKADMRFIGHWHQYQTIPGVCVNGSVIGYGAFARGLGFAPEDPKMQLQLLDKKRGFTLNTPIILKDF